MKAVGESHIYKILWLEMALGSRGNPTVEVDLTTSDGVFRASVPSGASTGVHEAVELRDGGSRFLGKGVLQAVKGVNDTIGPRLRGLDPTQQTVVDETLLELDGTANKSRLGANALLGVSLAVAKAGATAQRQPLYAHVAALAGKREIRLPVPALNVINGGSHAGNALAFQEFMILPTGAESFSEALQMGCEVYHTLKKVIQKQYGKDAINVGDEGGFAPAIRGAEEGLDLLMEAIAQAGYQGKIQLGLDAAASEFLVEGSNGMYDLDFKSGVRWAIPSLYDKCRIPVSWNSVLWLLFLMLLLIEKAGRFVERRIDARNGGNVPAPGGQVPDRID